MFHCLNSYSRSGAVVALLLVVTVSFAQEPATPTSPAGPLTEITFEKSTYSFGTIVEGAIVSQVFTFTNTGDEPLVLSEARGSCGCTVPEWPREAIQPGETASVTVAFDSRSKVGRRNQKVTLTANTNPSQTFIYLTGEITPREDSEVISLGEEVEVATEPGPDCFIVYPNPTAELLKLEIQERDLGQRALVTIYSHSGQLMARREIAAIEEAVIEFGVGHYPAGNYVAQVQIGAKKPESRCFVVQN